jgi:hypothetical protein
VAAGPVDRVAAGRRGSAWRWSIHLMLASLTVEDTPVGYAPPSARHGGAVDRRGRVTPISKARTARLRGSGAGRRGPRERPSRGPGRSPG